jgi:hypothetical protein
VTALRVAAHVHSTWSYDGSWTLEQIARAFARQGRDAVLMAEHDRTFDEDRWADYREACAEASAEGALLVPGIEYSNADNLVHTAVWGVEEFLGRERPTAELLEDARDGVSVIAHPGRRRAWETLAPECFELASGIEIWNRKYDGVAPGPAGVELARRHDLLPFAGLDFHTARQFFPLAMGADLSVPAEHPDEVIQALRQGQLTPTAFALPAGHFTDGRGLETVRAAEYARHQIARALRGIGRRRAALKGWRPQGKRTPMSRPSEAASLPGEPAASLKPL